MAIGTGDRNAKNQERKRGNENNNNRPRGDQQKRTISYRNALSDQNRSPPAMHSRGEGRRNQYVLAVGENVGPKRRMSDRKTVCLWMTLRGIVVKRGGQMGGPFMIFGVELFGVNLERWQESFLAFVFLREL